METLTLEIIDVAFGGRGVARHEGFVFFVPGTLPGETVEATVTKRHKKFGEATLNSVVSPSPKRISPVCPLADTCPGCCYQHVDYEEEVKLKQQQFSTLLTKIAKQDITPGTPIPSPEHLHYRNKISLHATGADDTPALGYVGEDNETIIDVANCPLAIDAINERLTLLRDDPELRATITPGSRLTLRYTKPNGAQHWIDKAPTGSDWMTENTTVGEMYVPAGGFFQVNPFASDQLTQDVSAAIQEIKPENVLDLYCGCGSFAIAVAESVTGRIVGIDYDRPAIDAARANAKARAMKNIQFMSGSAGKALASQIGLFKDSSSVLICDPPRTGLDKGVITSIGSIKPKHIVYVSCAADTLSRDIERLSAQGYSVVSTHLIDMFPRTAHFESVTQLRC
jgi:23S rRNA (uracil1939-C5)-methyltransferase